jgi:regulator of protease activity HflC (stomatin/prohibitin superfamily)
MVEWILLGAVVLVTVAFVAYRSVFHEVTVYESQRGLRYDKGRLVGILEPGRFRINRRTTMVQLVDIRESVTTIPGQEIVTSDGFSIKLSLAVRHRIVDPAIAYTKVDSHQSEMYAEIQVALRETISAMTIDDVLERRNEIAEEVLRRSKEPVLTLGVEVISAKVKDLMFPGPLKKTFPQVVEARQQGLAALERARGETAALRNLANAGRLVESNPSLLQLRLLQQLEASSGNTIVLGFPQSSTPIPVRDVQPTREISPGAESAESSSDG